VNDATGFCYFMQPTLDDMRQFFTYFFGEEFSRERIADYGWQILESEWEFNRRAGLTAADDVLPACTKEDPIGPDNVVFDVKPEVIARTKVRMPLRDELFTLQAGA
jgi:aldehyde:ferredoxin oxidoreductase